MQPQSLSLSLLSVSVITFLISLGSAYPMSLDPQHQQAGGQTHGRDIEDHVPSHLWPGRSWDSQHGRRDVSEVMQEAIIISSISSGNSAVEDHDLDLDLDLDDDVDDDVDFPFDQDLDLKLDLNLDLGSCPDARIVFTETANDGDASFFESRETAPTFRRVEAVDVDLIADFICHQLAVKCQASMEAIEACHAGAEAAKGKTGQDAADAFNAVLLRY